ncbi:zinc-binding dehydrogenase [Streptomyces sulfonofaciens]|nr:zinc-binding dehydrogenase [Streptomyces sulfonofaciens]
MNKVILTGIGDPGANARLTRTPVPPVGAKEVRLRMEAAPVNPVDYLFANGWYPVQPQLPSPIGSEGVGRVVEVGHGADTSLEGKRVVVLGTYEQGLWAEEVVVPARNVVVVPEHVDGLQLAMATINPATAHLMLTKYVRLRPGDWIGQTLGNSAVARWVVALAREAGVRTVSVVRSERAAAEAKAAGADLVFVDGDDVGERVAAALGDKRLRLLLDGLGGGDTTGRLATVLEAGGTVVSYSSVDGAAPVLPLGDLVFAELALRGVWVVNWFRQAPRAEIEKAVGGFVDLIARGAVAVPVDSVHGLERFEDALSRDASPERSGKVLIRLSGAAS